MSAALVAGLVAAGVVLLVHRTGTTAPPVAARSTATASPSPVPTATPSVDPGSGSGAVQFSDPDGHFSAVYAAQPVRDDQTETVKGVAVAYTQWAAIVSVNEAEIVGYASYPGGQQVSAPNAALEAAVAGEAETTKATVLSKKLGTTQGFPSIDAVLSGDGGFIETRVVLAGHSLFVIIAAGLDNPPADFATFAPTVQILSHTP